MQFKYKINPGCIEATGIQSLAYALNEVFDLDFIPKQCRKGLGAWTLRTKSSRKYVQFTDNIFEYLNSNYDLNILVELSTSTKSVFTLYIDNEILSSYQTSEVEEESTDLDVADIDLDYVDSLDDTEDIRDYACKFNLAMFYDTSLIDMKTFIENAKNGGDTKQYKS